MKLAIVTVGSQGDIDPLIALGVELEKAGHAVKLIANSDGREQAARYRLDFGDLQFSVAEIMRSATGVSMLQSASSHRSRTFLLDAAIAHFPIVAPRIVDLCHGADAVLSTETIHLLCSSIAEKLDVPHIALGFVPYGRTESYPSFYADTPKLRRLSNGATHDFIERFHHEKLLPSVNAVRSRHLRLRELDADAAYRGRESCPAVMGYSPSVFPPPPDWPVHRDVTGYWSLSGGRIADDTDATGSIDPHIVEFVEAGSPPLYVGFGSMQYDPRHLVRMLETAARETGVRIIYCTGWTTDNSPDRPGASGAICVTPQVPHAWLLPRTIGALHHGGAGTTASAIIAGVPSLIAWFIVDQVFWARRAAQLGVGIDLGCFQQLTEESLVAAIRRLQYDSGLKRNAGLLGMKVRDEDGLCNAARAIGRHLRIHRE